MAKNPHAIMIAFPYQGHITPFMNLALKIASKGFTISFVHTEYIHYTLSKAAHRGNTIDQVDCFSEARESGFDIRYTTISDGFPLEFDRTLHIKEYWETMLRDFPNRVDAFVSKTLVQSETKYFLIADTYYSWPATIANKHNLLNVSFWTQPALVFSIDYHLNLLRENGHFPGKDNADEEISYIPGVKSINTRDLMSYLNESEEMKLVKKVVFKAFDEVKKADYILFNTADELERDTPSALNQKQPAYAVGPVNFSRNLLKTTVSQSLRSESDCTEWLNSKPPGSVLYISFGSHSQTVKHVIEEIAHGLILSEVNFIWVVREDIAQVFPDGFEDEIKDRGLVIPWCNQIMVLSNLAVGGFLTHCGWNSVIESIWGGVPMICCPLFTDQPSNRKLVVDDWKIGVNLYNGKTSIDRSKVAEKIKKLISRGPISRALKQEVEKLNVILKNALEKDGSSERNFDHFVKDLKLKLHAKP